MESVFTEKEIRDMIASGDLTQEELEILESAGAVVDTIDLVGDPAEVVAQLASLPDRPETNSVEQILKTAETDEKFFARLMSLVAISKQAEVADNKCHDPVINALSDEEYVKASVNFYQNLQSMPLEKRKELFAILTDLSTEQRKDLVSQLLKMN